MAKADKGVEMLLPSPDYLEDYIAFRHLDPCKAYKARYRLFTERVAYLDSAGV